MEGYGKRVQYSVFECQLSQVKIDELRSRLRQRVKLSEDSVRFYPLSRHTLGQVEIWGEPPLTEVSSSIVI
ncbi:MAG: CRISPR-associated endonuclease Cas2 [Symploca sp. SIO1A3]|nr:CRISPR-associated endonuclease Cas2 [Symploca sp. SIO1A3]